MMFIVKRSQQSIILQYGVEGRPWILKKDTNLLGWCSAPLLQIPLHKWLYLLNAGGDGGDDQHEGEGDHHPVLEVGHLEQEGHESNDDEDGLLKEHAEKVVLNLPAKM